jgi:chromosome partitioning protein
MPRTISIANHKGGVGKTALALNLAAAYVEDNQRVLLVDLDPQGSLTLCTGTDPLKLRNTIYDWLLAEAMPIDEVVVHVRPRLDLLPATIELAGWEVDLAREEVGREYALREKLAGIAGAYDVLIVDCPPTLGALTVNALVASDGVLVPVQCHWLALRGLHLLQRTIRKIQTRVNPGLKVLGVVPTFYDSRTVHCREVLEELRGKYSDILIDVPVRTRVAVADAVVAGQSILEYDPQSDVAESYREIAKRVSANA